MTVRAKLEAVLQAIGQKYYLCMIYAHKNVLLAAILGGVFGLGLLSPMLLSMLALHSLTPLHLQLLGIWMGICAAYSALALKIIYPSNQLMVDLVKGQHEGCLKSALNAKLEASEVLEHNIVGDPNALRGYNALHVAVLNQDQAAVEQLLKSGFEINQLSSRKEVIRMEREVVIANRHQFNGMGYNVEVIYYPVYGELAQKRTALHLACEQDNLSMVWLLVKNGADCSLLDEMSRKPFDLLPVDTKNFVEARSALPDSLLTRTAITMINRPSTQECMYADFVDILERTTDALVFNPLRYGVLTYTAANLSPTSSPMLTNPKL